MVLLTTAALAPALWLGHPLTKTRPPVDWTGAPCMTVVDRSVDPVVELSYAVLMDDLEVGAEEPPNSHTMQFFGFCRDRRLDAPPPNWISEADLDDAASFGLGDPDTVDRETEVLDNAPQWAGCFVRITADDARRPISFEAAAEPVVWDTSALAAGTWVVEGYTYEPWYNRWSPHPGAFKIVDDPDPAASEPAAALTFEEQTQFGTGEFEVSGCVSAMAGATMSLSWAHAPDPDLPDAEPSWELFASDLPVEGEDFATTWTPPQSAGNVPILVALEVVDPEGRSFTAHSIAPLLLLTVAGGDDETGGDETGGDETGGDETGETDAPLDDSGTGSCSCRSDGEAPRPLAALALLIPLFARRPRRR